MTTKINAYEILSNEYGIESTKELAEKINRIPIVCGKTLAERIADKERGRTTIELAAMWRVEERQEKNLESERDQKWHNIVYARQVTQILEECDHNTRHEYAWVTARSLKWGMTVGENKFARKLFVALRMSKLWRWTEVEAVEDLVKVVRQHVEIESIYAGTMGAWDWCIGNIVDLCRTKMNLKQINRFMGLVEGLRDANTCISTKRDQYAGGFHFGDWVYNACRGIRGQHVNLFNTFMRVYKHTHKISPKITGRYLKVFEKMDDTTLKFTATDSRNWSVNEYGNYKFRMDVVVREISNWQPLRWNHKRDQLWLAKFNRIPMERNIYRLPVELIENFTKKSFGLFVKEAKWKEWFSDDNNDNLLALARLTVWFGKDYCKYASDCDRRIHDAGINLPNVPFQDGRRFLKRYTHRINDAQRILPNWQYCLDNGVNPLGKEGLANCKALCMALIYEGVKDGDFARECAKWLVKQSDFNEWQDAWMKYQNITYEAIPKIMISDSDWKFYRLDKDDCRGLFLGHYTGCCQHPDGAGANCSWQGVLNPDSSFVVLEHRGEIKFQSWVWRHKNTLVFDNIEGNCRKEIMDEAKRMYLKGINAFKGVFGITKLYVGTGNSDIKLDLLVKSNPIKENPANDPQAPFKLGYPKPRDTWNCTDSMNIWEVTNEQNG